MCVVIWYIVTNLYILVLASFKCGCVNNFFPGKFHRVKVSATLSTFCEIISRNRPSWTPAPECVPIQQQVLRFNGSAHLEDHHPIVFHIGENKLPCDPRLVLPDEHLGRRWRWIMEMKVWADTKIKVYIFSIYGEHLVWTRLSSDLHEMPVIWGWWWGLLVVALHFLFDSWICHKQKSFRFVTKCCP